MKAAFTVKLYLHYDTSFWGALMWLLELFFPNKLIFEVLRARNLAAGFGDTNTAINIALDLLICNGNSVLR